jgi:mRNA interferase MazF
VDFDPVEGNEQGGARPAVVVSAPGHLVLVGGRLVTVCPVTSRDRKLPHHVPIAAGRTHRLDRPSWVMTEQSRTISQRRVGRTLGDLTAADLAEVLRNLHRLIASPPAPV